MIEINAFSENHVDCNCQYWPVQGSWLLWPLSLINQGSGTGWDIKRVVQQSHNQYPLFTERLTLVHRLFVTILTWISLYCYFLCEYFNWQKIRCRERVYPYDIIVHNGGLEQYWVKSFGTIVCTISGNVPTNFELQQLKGTLLLKWEK